MTVPVQLDHVSIPAKDPKELAGFYRQLLGLEVTMAGSVPGLGDFVFLNERPHSRRPEAADLWTALVTGMVNQQIANDPAGNRRERLADEAIAMFAGHMERMEKPG